MLSTMTATTPSMESALYMVMLGLGVGSTMQVTVLAVQNAVPHKDLGVATSSAQFFRQMGGSFGVGAFGAIMNSRLGIELPNRVPAAALVDVGGDVTRLLNSPASIRALPPEVMRGVASSVELGIQEVFFWAALLMVLGFVLTWFLKEIPLRETVGPEEGVY